MSDINGINQHVLDGLSSLESEVCQATAKEIGGIDAVMEKLGVDVKIGLNKEQVEKHRAMFGPNMFPESPMESYLDLLIGALNDQLLLC